MANTCYDNFFLSNEIEDQYQSHLDLQQFCTVDNNLTGVAGMVRKIHKYKATDGTEKLTMGNGNTKTIEAGYTEKEYRIQMAQNRFQYYDEEAMTDPMVITTGTRHAGTDMFNTVNADIFGAFNEATMTIVTTALGFDAFVDGAAMLNLENLEGVTIFGFVNPADMAKLRKALKDDLKYVEAYAKQGYVGTVGGINIYTKKNAETGKVVIATKEAVTLFNKKGTEVEQEREGNIRRNTVYSRKYYLAAMTNEAKAVKIITGSAAVTADTTVSLLDMVLTNVQWRIKNLSNLSDIPEGLESLAVSMAVGEYLNMKKCSGQLEGFDLDAAAVKSIQEGDTNITFALGEGSSTPEQRLNSLIDYLINGRIGEIYRYRRLVW